MITNESQSQMHAVEIPTVIELAGDIDVLGMAGVIATLKAAAKRRSPAVIVSFERNTHFESSLLSELMRIGRSLEAEQRRLLIVMPRKHPGRQIFHLLNLDKMFECHESAAQALGNAISATASGGSDRDRLRSWAQPQAGTTA